MVRLSVHPAGTEVSVVVEQKHPSPSGRVWGWGGGVRVGKVPAVRDKVTAPSILKEPLQSRAAACRVLPTLFPSTNDYPVQLNKEGKHGAGLPGVFGAQQSWRGMIVALVCSAGGISASVGLEGRVSS